jgi:hypothetical protein
LKKERKLRENWKAFTSSAQTFLAKAEACQKASDAKTFYELAESASQHALALWIELESNSILLYLQTTIAPVWGDYKDFCARNGLEVLDEAAFEAVLDEIKR